MSYLFEKPADGSLILTMDGNLQFDSRDERIYHECLIGPAMALQAGKSFCSVLIVGGGDGLAARELLKNESVKSVHLIDRDEQITSIASSNTDLVLLNGASLLDSRVSVTTCDAWDFVKQSTNKYDVIVADLTVPRSKSDTRMFSVEWYQMLRSILTDSGSLAVNAASPCQTPRAYWSIVNSMRASGLWARPYRIALPSFQNAGYGPDWGFVLASNSIPASSMLESLRCSEWQRLFRFPNEIADCRHSSPRVLMQANDLLDAFRSINFAKDPWLSEWDGLFFDLDSEAIPPGLSRELMIPLAVKQAFEHGLASSVLFERLQQVMPALNDLQSQAIVADFLSAPWRFLASIDLSALINYLVERAQDLPRSIREELEYLRNMLPTVNMPDFDFSSISSHAITVIALVMIIGNLISPDVAYGKASVGGMAAAGHAGSIGIGHMCGGGVHSFSHSTACNMTSPMSHGIAARLGFQRLFTASNGRHVRCFPFDWYQNWTPLQYGHPSQPVTEMPLYLLTDDVYILPNAMVGTMLNERTCLVFGPTFNTLIDTHSGMPMIQLYAEPQQIRALTSYLDTEVANIEQQRSAYQTLMANASALPPGSIPAFQTQEQAQAIASLDLLRQSRQQLMPNSTNPDGETRVSRPPEPPPSFSADSFELFSGAWLDNDGRCAAMHLADGSFAYTDGKSWYSDPQMSQKLPAAFPHALHKFLTAFVKDQIHKGSDIIKEQDLELARQREKLEVLRGENESYQSRNELSQLENSNTTVSYGVLQVPVEEALQKTQAEMESTERDISEIQSQHDKNDRETAMLRRLYVTLERRS